MASVPLFLRKKHLPKCSSFRGAFPQTAETLAWFLEVAAGTQYFNFPVLHLLEKLNSLQRNWANGPYIYFWSVVAGMVPLRGLPCCGALGWQLELWLLKLTKGFQLATSCSDADGSLVEMLNPRWSWRCNISGKLKDAEVAFPCTFSWKFLFLFFFSSLFWFLYTGYLVFQKWTIISVSRQHEHSACL